MKIIDNVHHWWSVRLAAGWTFLMAGVNFVSTVFPQTWNSIPDDIRGHLPAWIGLLIAASLLLARIIPQAPPAPKPAAPDGQ